MNAKCTKRNEIIVIIMNIKELWEHRNCSSACCSTPRSTFEVPRIKSKCTPDFEMIIFSSQVHVHNCARCNLKIILHGNYNYGASCWRIREMVENVAQNEFKVAAKCSRQLQIFSLLKNSHETFTRTFATIPAAVVKCFHVSRFAKRSRLCGELSNS